IIINEMGFTYVYRLQDETGSSVAAIVRAYMITRTVLDLESIWKQIEDLGTSLSAVKQIDMMMIYVRLSRRVTRWFLRHQRKALDITQTVKLFSDGFVELKKAMPEIYSENSKVQYDKHYQEHIDDGVPPNLAHELTVTRGLFSATDIIEIAHQRALKISKVAETYFGIEGFLDLAWIRTQIIIHPTENHWESLSREALRDDLDWQQRQLAAGFIDFDANNTDMSNRLETWGATYKELIIRWHCILDDLRSSTILTYIMFFVAIRELLDLTQSTVQSDSKEG
ncbi:MAG: NAD-glutamate dehydrogenase, partial [Legionellales bacterium]